MRLLLEKLIQRKNQDFKFDPSVSKRILLILVIEKFSYLIRAFFYSIVRLKKPVLFLLGKNVKFFNSKNIVIEKWVRIENGVYLSGLGRAKLKIGKSSSIGAYSQLVISMSFNNIGEHITIGEHVGIGQFASIGGSGGVTIGDHCIIGQYFSCHPENHIFTNPNKLIKNQGTERKEIVIGRNCWIGAKVTILAGVTIGAGCVVAAGAVVTESVPENSIVGGVPARIIKSRI